MKKLAAFVLLGFLSIGPARFKADTESANWIYVAAADTDGTTWRGDRYAKCIPGEERGTNGETRIYRVEKEKDVLEHTYNWYSTQVYLSSANKKTSVVRIGPWNEGAGASSNDLGVAFYYDGRLLKAYSTLSIVGRPTNVSSSVSHYEWIHRIDGYGWIDSASSSSLIWGFTLKTADGRTLCFDVMTGEMVLDGKRSGR